MRQARSPATLRVRTAGALPKRLRPPVEGAWSARPLAGQGLSAAAKRQLLVEVLGFLALYALVVNYIVGAIGAVVFLACAAGVLALGPRQSLQGIARVAPLFALPLLALLSAQWSEAPGTTTRAALQVLVTATAAAVFGARLSERTVILGLFLGLLTVCSTGIPEIPGGWRSGYPIQGSFGSKNAFGIHAQFLEIFALAIALDRVRAWPLRLFALTALLLSLVLVHLARSGGAELLAGLTLVLFPLLLLFGRFPVWARISALAMATIMVVAGLILAPQINALIAWFRTDVLGKDATLTGRTELWDIADKLVAERPLLGHGYFAFWRLGNPEAEAIWRNFGVGRGGGFNFHNEIVEFSVGLGSVGVGLLIALCLLVAGLAATRQILRPSYLSAVALTALVTMYARAFVETGLIAPFSIVLAYWFIIASRSVAEVRTGWAPTGEGGAGAPPAGPRSDAAHGRGVRGQVVSRRD